MMAFNDGWWCLKLALDDVERWCSWWPMKQQGIMVAARTWKTRRGKTITGVDNNHSEFDQPSIDDGFILLDSLNSGYNNSRRDITWLEQEEQGYDMISQSWYGQTTITILPMCTTPWAQNYWSSRVIAKKRSFYQSLLGVSTFAHQQHLGCEDQTLISSGVSLTLRCWV